MSEELRDPAAAHRPAIERVLRLMHDRLDEQLALEDLAAEAYLSPFHFSRVFRQVTGAPPGEFLSALRLDRARRLLLTSPISVTEVCCEVGYSSLGSFTTRFTQLVGAAPTALRRLAHGPRPADVGALMAPGARRAAGGASVSGVVRGPVRGRATICIGLFPRAIPQGMPLACTQLSSPGAFVIRGVPDGDYHLLAAALPASDDAMAYLVPGEELLVAASAGAVRVRAAQPPAGLVLELRRPRPTDPPLVAPLPLLLARWLAPDEHTCEERKIGEARAAPGG